MLGSTFAQWRDPTIGTRLGVVEVQATCGSMALATPEAAREALACTVRTQQVRMERLLPVYLSSHRMLECDPYTSDIRLKQCGSTGERYHLGIVACYSHPEVGLRSLGPRICEATPSVDVVSGHVPAGLSVLGCQIPNHVIVQRVT